MKIPQPVLLLVGWLLIVTASSSLSWAVISRAGSNLGTDTGLNSTVGNWPSPRPTSPSETSEFTTPRFTGATPVTLTKTWVGSAGRVSASCIAGQISLTGAEPNVGYRVVVVATGPVNVSVRFLLTDSSGTQVDSTCGTAGPAFTTRSI